jgi:hypothetical protein
MMFMRRFFFEFFHAIRLKQHMTGFAQKLGLVTALAAMLGLAGCASAGSAKEDSVASNSACPAHLKLTCERFPGQKTHCYCSSREDVRDFLWLGREWHRN